MKGSTECASSYQVWITNVGDTEYLNLPLGTTAKVAGMWGPQNGNLTLYRLSWPDNHFEG